ncbi:hypothetical protein Q8W71_20170 [Methylobacterium sp. NEAU 140]|nr:hypothetical protein [Methylobacterium sp. NEAU 140]MDP4024948.1 hypothetical protein [Methylobacterium sp. NEAU 140]
MRDLLTIVPDDPANPYRETARVMAEAVAELDKLLDVLSGSAPPRG